MKKVVIEVSNISKKIKNKVILKDINLNIYRGDFFGLLGLNGSGKTTLIQILLSMIEPDSGYIKIFNFPINKKLSCINQKINFISCYNNLQEQITVYENLLTYAKLYGIKNPRKKIFDLFNFFNFNDYSIMKKKFIDLSSGEKMKVKFCKALINDPDILFLDEPTNNLDPIIKRKTINLIKMLNYKKKTTIFFASHDIDEIKRICSRIAILKEGKIQEIDNFKNNRNILKFF